MILILQHLERNHITKFKLSLNFEHSGRGGIEQLRWHWGLVLQLLDYFWKNTVSFGMGLFAFSFHNFINFTLCSNQWNITETGQKRAWRTLPCSMLQAQSLSYGQVMFALLGGLLLKLFLLYKIRQKLCMWLNLSAVVKSSFWD